MVRLRKGDALQDVAEDLNAALTGLRDLVSQDRVLLGEVREEVAAALDGKSDLEPILEKIDQISSGYLLSDEELISSPEESLASSVTSD